jgi:uncharacterized protein
VDSRLISYIYFFNIQRDYYECHEYGESLWLDTGRPIVLKGLIQAAVCLYHLHNGNVKGGWRMWQRARQYISGERPIYESIDLDHLTQDIDEVFGHVPTTWYDQMRSESDIKALNLPTVMLQIVDVKISELLHTWVPGALDHEDIK